MPLDTPFPTLLSSEGVDALIARNRTPAPDPLFSMERRAFAGMVVVTPVLRNHQPKDVRDV